MPITKSGTETPVDPPKEKLEAPVKHYPASGPLGKGGPHGTVEGPAKKK